MAKGTIGERVYRRLLRLYPRDFSDDYADEMTHLYRDRVRGEGATQRVAGARRRSGAHRAQGAGLDARAGRATRVADVAADARPCAGGDSDAGAGRRREHRRLQRRARRAPEAACRIRMRIVSSRSSRTIPAPAAGPSSACRCSTICRGSSAPGASTRWLPSTAGTSPSPSMVTRSASLEAPLPPRCSRCSASRRSSGDR